MKRLTSFNARARADAGQALVETLSLLPLIAAIAVGVASFAVWAVARNVVEAAASAAAIASLEGTDSRAAVASSIPGWAKSRLVVGSIRGGDVVTVNLNHLPQGPWLGLGSARATFDLGSGSVAGFGPVRSQPSGRRFP